MMLRMALLLAVGVAVPLSSSTLATGRAASQQVVPPEQFHISYSAQPNSMWVTWVTPGASTSAQLQPLCLYWSNSSNLQQVNASTKTYTDNRDGCRSDHAYGGPCVPWRGLIHSVLLTGLLPHFSKGVEGQRGHVWYRCGVTGQALSAIRSFRAPPTAENEFGEVTFGLLGDQGTAMVNPNGGMEKYNHTYPGAIFVRDDILSTPDVRFVHLFGDISYANGNQPVWDGYGRDMDVLHSAVPALLSPGNHDGEFTFGNRYSSAGEGGGDSGVAYAMRYPGPGAAVPFDSPHVGPFESTSMYWSVNSGPVHLVATAGVLDFEPGSAQYAWLEADLAAASSETARKLRPWIVVTNHYPLYCTLVSCNTPSGVEPVSMAAETATQAPIPPSISAISPERLRQALEPLLLKYQVDAVFVGHNHNMERTHAVANLTVVSRGEPWQGGRMYKSPGAPIHWVVGSGGADPDTLAQWKNSSASPIPWLATQLYDDARESTNWGWAQVTANRSCMQVQFNDAYRKQRGLDSVWITK